MKKVVGSVLRIFTSVIFIIILLYVMRAKYNAIFIALKGTKISIFALGFIAYSCAIAIASLRFKLIIGTQGIPIRFLEALSLTFIGYFFNNFLPTTIGGDVVKAYYLSKKSGEALGSFTSVLVDRFIGLFTMIIMAFCATIFAKGQAIDNTIKYLIYAITAASGLATIFIANRSFAKVFSVFLVFLRPIEEKLKKAYSAINKYTHHRILLFQTFFISIVSQILFFLSFGIFALSIGSHIPIIEILLRIPIISVLSLLPSINGLGLREGSTVVFFGPMIGKENAFAVSVLWLLALLMTSLIGGMIYGLSPQFKMTFKEIEKKEVLI